MLENHDFRPAGGRDPIGQTPNLTTLSPFEGMPTELRRKLERSAEARTISRWAHIALIALIAILALGALFAPYVYAEFEPLIDGHRVVASGTPALAKGRMVDDYWAVQQIDPRTYAIGEPRYYQQNYTYLLVGTQRALLFDSGSGTRDIGHVVAGLTKLPVTVIPSHLHYDHLGGIKPFSSVAMIDLPETRADVTGDRFKPGRYEYLGFSDGRRPPSFHVAQWLPPGIGIDLGGRIIEVLHTPGHTGSSVSLFDPRARQLFSGDFIYPTTLYADYPGASLSAY